MSFVRRALRDLVFALGATLLVVGSATVGLIGSAAPAHAAEVPVNPAPTGNCQLGNGV
jgi:hypothetical protein